MKHLKMCLLLSVIVGYSYAQKSDFFPIKSDSLIEIQKQIDAFGEEIFVAKNYPIRIKDKAPLEKAFYRSRENLLDVISTIYLSCIYLSKEEMRIRNNQIKGYFVITCDSAYIYSGVLKQENEHLYMTYNPSNLEKTSLKTKNHKKFYNWLVQEMNKEAVVSIIMNHKAYLAKSFSKK